MEANFECSQFSFQMIILIVVLSPQKSFATQFKNPG